MKNLYKSETNKMISGVCGGIAEYLGVDSTLVRIVTFFLMMCAGSGLLAYIVAAVIMPEAETAQ